MMTSRFVITIDTEGDNIWQRQSPVTTENVRFLPRFQQLCEKHSLKVTYLVNYEMAIDPRLQEFGKQILQDQTGEIGLHIHPWNSPPLSLSKNGTNVPHSYLYEYPEEIIFAKLQFMTDLLSSTFSVRPVSHRAGKWGFDARIARALMKLDYLVDCSITPGVSWKKYKGNPDGNGGPDYYEFSLKPYFLSPEDIRHEGLSTLLEVPVTIQPLYDSGLEKVYKPVRKYFAGKFFRAFFGLPYAWMRPTGKNLNALLSTIDWACRERMPVIQFVLHSSELMPAGSPNFSTADHIEKLYEDLEILFSYVRKMNLPGTTLAEYRSTFVAEHSTG
jgi:hypothetical protein